jgi:hypothetical protein
LAKLRRNDLIIYWISAAFILAKTEMAKNREERETQSSYITSVSDLYPIYSD